MTPKQEHDAKEALRGALKTIEDQQRDIETLTIKARAFETFAALVSAMSPQRVAMRMAPDAAWILRKLLDEIEATEKEAAKAAQDAKEQADDTFS